MTRRSRPQQDADLVHRMVLHDTLRRALADAPETRGLALPPEFEINPTPEGHLRFQLGPVDLVDNSRIIHDAWSVAVPEVVRDMEIHDAIGMMHIAIRRAAQQSDELRPPPSWKVLGHPIAVALALGHEPDRSRYPLSLRSGQSAGPNNWDVDPADGKPTHKGEHFVASADCVLREEEVLHFSSLGVIAQRTLSALTFHSPRAGTHALSIPGRIPEVLKDSLLGRTLGEFAELPPTGYAEVDAAAHACRIVEHKQLANGVTLVFDATDHIPYGEAPDQASARAMRLAPVRL